MPKYAELVYNGFWFSPEREMLQAAIDKSQEFVTGSVRLKLYKGNVAVVGLNLALFALRSGARHLRGWQGRLRPTRRRRVHPFECAAAADARAAHQASWESSSQEDYSPDFRGGRKAGEPNSSRCPRGQRSSEMSTSTSTNWTQLCGLLCRVPPRHSPSRSQTVWGDAIELEAAPVAFERQRP